MTDEFKAFIEAELDAIRQAVEKMCSRETVSRRDAAMLWVERNAAKFREQWKSKETA